MPHDVQFSERLKRDAAANDDRAGFRESVLAGLSRPQKVLDCKYLYDSRGSRLFDEICGLPEYYPTRTETAILEQHAAAIAEAAGPGAELVELGSGASIKSRILLSALARPARYLPLDIAVDHMQAAADELRALYPGLAVEPVAADFTAPFSLPPKGPGRRLLFFPGSTIGNFDRDSAGRLLQRFRRELQADLFVIGVDLRKDARILHAAYDDATGVTAAFNLNLLVRINRELDGRFDLERFRHHARVVDRLGRVEMHLVSLIDQDVRIGDRIVSFAAGETIHTENSHKYALDEFVALAARAGWTGDTAWTDARRLFSVHLLRP
ncbi:MAG: L-histidine N(alpha)-methyltransferase [Alphaproteobacteria bacterium]